MFDLAQKGSIDLKNRRRARVVEPTAENIIDGLAGPENSYCPAPTVYANCKEHGFPRRLSSTARSRKSEGHGDVFLDSLHTAVRNSLEEDRRVAIRSARVAERAFARHQ